jgi:hypothetical protein
MNHELKQRFPIQYAMFEEAQTSIVKVGQIEYDSSRVSRIKPEILDLFITYQRFYPSKINDCISILHSILELQENEYNLKELTGKPINQNIVHYRDQKTQDYMQQIYEILQWEYHILMGQSLLEPVQSYILDNWVSFIKSQILIYKKV